MEVTAHSGYFWNRRWETDIIEQLSFGRILCYAAKWLGKKTFVRGWIDFRRNKELCLVKELWKLLDECDILIGQNCRAFDIKWCNAAFARYDLPPPSPYKVIDTKIEAKKYLYLPSYALNNLADYFGLGRKVEHEGFSLWLRCIKGDKQAWKRMKKYNKRDTELTEKIYLKLRSFIVSHPNIGMYMGKATCPRCGSNNLISRGWQINQKTKYRRMSCLGCGGWMRAPENINKVKQNTGI